MFLIAREMIRFKVKFSCETIASQRLLERASRFPEMV
jgi:hypothetical protein